MPINQIADSYLSIITDGNTKLEGGLGFEKYLDLKKLDGSEESLKYVDALLDDIHRQERPGDSFYDEQANINFVYLLAFYCGRVVERSTGHAATWYQKEELVADNPELGEILVGGIEHSILCTHKGALFIPLASIMTRLFEGPEEKSVWFSTSGQINNLKKAAAPPQAPRRGPPRRNPPPPTKAWWKFW
jgi:hypothetical protein